MILHTRTIPHALSTACLRLIVGGACFVPTLPFADIAYGEAEVLDVSGLPLEVSDARSVSPAITKITIFGETRLVESERVADYVLDAYLADPARLDSISTKTLLASVSTALAERSVDRACRLFTGITKDPRVTTASLMDLLRGIQSDKKTNSEFYREMSLRLRDTKVSAQVASKILLSASIDSPSWVRQNVIGLVYILGDEFRLLAKEDFFRAARDGAIPQSDQVVDAVRAIFGEDDVLSRKLQAFRLTLQSAREYVKVGDMESLVRLGEASREQPEILAILQPLIGEAVLKNAARLIGERKPGNALAVLARLDLSTRTPLLHDLVRKSLDQLRPGSDSPLLDPQITMALTKLAAFDEAVQSKHLSLLEEQIRYLCDFRDLSRAEGLFRVLLRTRPDPSPENDALRVYQAAAYVRAGEVGYASRKLEEVTGGISLRDRMRLFTVGYYVDPVVLLVSCTLLFFVILLSYLRKHSGQIAEPSGMNRRPRTASAETEEPADPTEPPVFAARPRNHALEEYRECIKQFGLEPGVTLKDLKVAYRSSVKAHHPDTRREGDDSSNDRFIELTKAYERAVELHKRIGGI